MKKTVLLIFTLLLTTALVSCGPKRIKVGILQYVSHQDLDDVKDGFIKELAENGFVNKDNITITVLNPEADTASLQSMSAKLVRESDLIFAIATPAAVSVVNEAKSKGKKTPILFSAVTDPVNAKLVTSLENHNSNVSGTTDMTPIKEQIALIKEVKPDATKVGILYTASETNSEIQARIAEEEIKAIGLTPVVKSFAQVSDITGIYGSLINTDKVDAIFIPSDNIISSSMGILKTLSITHAKAKVPVIASTTFQVTGGASITYGLNYFNLGVQTGQMGVKVLNGTDIKDLDVESIEILELAINKYNIFDLLGLSVSQELLDKADIIWDKE